VTVTASDDDAVAVTYADPPGGTRAVTHAALATVELAWRDRGGSELALSGDGGAYEYGTRHVMPGITPRPLPEG
jgi:hypothetical protein